MTERDGVSAEVAKGQVENLMRLTGFLGNVSPDLLGKVFRNLQGSSGYTCSGESDVDGGLKYFVRETNGFDTRNIVHYMVPNDGATWAVNGMAVLDALGNTLQYEAVVKVGGVIEVNMEGGTGSKIAPSHFEIRSLDGNQ